MAMAGMIRQVALLVAVLAVTVAPVRAQEQPKAPPPKETLTEQTEKAFRKSIETILKALEKLVDSVPIYEAPEVLENGDILIRRKRPDAAPREEKKEKSPDTSRT
jgi:hypothetical protein